MNKTLITSLLALGLASAASAQTIVDWDANSSNTLRSQSGVSDTLFSASTTLTAAGNGEPATFGGTFVDTDATPTAPTVKNWQYGTLDSDEPALREQIERNGATAYDFALLIDVSGSTPTLNTTDTFTALFTSANASSAGAVRWLVYNDSTLYASAQVATSIPFKTATDKTVSSDLSGLDWFAVTNSTTPGTGIATFAGTPTATSTVFDTVSSIGLLVQAPAGEVRFAGFDAVAIPEPSSFALLAGALGLGLVMLRRRR